MIHDEIRELLGEMRDEPVPADSLVRVRELVEQRVRRRHRWWRWAGAAAATVAVGIMVMMVRTPAPRPVEAPKLEPVVAREAEVARPVERLPKKAAAGPRRAEAAALIRIETPDPNVVILLVGND